MSDYWLVTVGFLAVGVIGVVAAAPLGRLQAELWGLGTGGEAFCRVGYRAAGCAMMVVGISRVLGAVF